MIAFLAVLNLALALGTLHLLYRLLRQQGLGIGNVSLLIMVLTNVIGVSLLPGVLMKEGLHTGNVDLHFDPNAYVHQVLTSAIFLCASYGFMRSEFSQSRLRSLSDPKPLDRGLTFIIGVLVGGIGLCLWARFMVYGDGLQFALNTRYDQFSFYAASVQRSEVRDSLRTGQGYFMALVASFAVLPLSVAILRLLGRQHLVFRVAWLLGLTLSLLFAVSLRQKAPPLLMLLCYGGIVAAGGWKRQRLRARIGRRGLYVLVAALSVALLSVAVFYWISEGELFTVSVQQAVERVFVTQAASAHLWYGVFPAQLPFRGIPETFYILSPEETGPYAVTIRDVASAATGVEFSANAWFLAVAWSGWGYGGIVLATTTLFALLRLLDSLTVNFVRLPHQLALALFTPALLPLMSSQGVDIILVGSVPAIIAFVVFLKVAHR